MGLQRTVAIIGSGFGGAVTACRLAESGRYRVTVLERGPRYRRNGFPRSADALRDAIWNPSAGTFGLFEYQSFSGTPIDALTASGLGGGSLIYSNVLYRMPAEFFRGWPGGLTREALDPFYDEALAMLEARPYPASEAGSPYAMMPKSAVFASAAAKMARKPLGKPATALEYPPLAITFGPEPGAEKKNRHGASQSACTMCGECNIGCNVHAKNTLDLNYLHRASSAGATMETFAEVRRVVAEPGGGYTVVWGDPRRPSDERRLEVDMVVVAAGSLGSPKLLLRMKRDGHLPQLGAALGTRWAPNGDLLGFCTDSPEPVHPTVGPVITSAIRFFDGSYPDGSPHGIYIEDAGIPNMIAWYIAAYTDGGGARLHRARGYLNYLTGLFHKRREVNIGTDVAQMFFADGRIVRHTLPMLGMGLDRSVGVLSVTTRDPSELQLRWDAAESALHYDRARAAMHRIAAAMGGVFVENLLSLLPKYITVHPLGGCPMADVQDQGVVDARTGEVFGHPGLFVIDGSILPSSAGVNPSLTIAALAEKFAKKLCS